VTQRPFVLTVPEIGAVSSHADFDLYVPADAVSPRPAVVIVPGPIPADYPVRPRQWPMFTGYGHLLASRGVTAAVVNLPYYNPVEWAEVSSALPGVVASVRDRPEVDADRVAIWAFSGGGLLVGRWFGESPPWLRCLALTYPLLGDVAGLRPGRPIVLTQVGLEQPQLQATVSRFLVQAVKTGTTLNVIDVPNGHHGFDVADHTEESRQAVVAAADYVVENLAR
jgi:dienelactone hydrolase